MSRTVCHTGTANTHHSDVHLNGGASMPGKTSDLGDPKKVKRPQLAPQGAGPLFGNVLLLGDRSAPYYIPLTCASLIDFTKLGK
jgi:hypothetical protein